MEHDAWWPFILIAEACRRPCKFPTQGNYPGPELAFGITDWWL